MVTPDLNALWDAHVAAEFATKDAVESCDTMVPHATVNHVPTMTGGVGRDQLLEFYGKHFIPGMPPDTKITPVDRTVGKDTVVDEMLFEFTHTVTMGWILPGVPPTGRHVRIPLLAVVKFEGDKLSAERIYWDQASVLLQIGLLPDDGSLPITGAAQAEKHLDIASLPSNQLIEAAIKKAAE